MGNETDDGDKSDPLETMPPPAMRYARYVAESAMGPAIEAPESEPEPQQWTSSDTDRLLDSLPLESLPLDLLGPVSSRLSWIEESAPVSEIPVSTTFTSTFVPPSIRTTIRSLRYIAGSIMRPIFTRRRLAEPLMCGVGCTDCLAPHLDKITGFVLRREPIHFVIPAFPAKSGNHRKVLGRLPDKAEELALVFLENLCQRIAGLYSLGAKITICSDGHVFGDVVGITDDDISAYGRELRAVLERLKTQYLHVFDLTDHFGQISHEEMRVKLLGEFAKPLSLVREQAATDTAARRMYNGISRFLFEDFLVLEPDKTRTQIRNMIKDRAYKTVQRSDAWSNLVERAFPEAIRLSIHPQPPHSAKIGIHLVETLDVWQTPWHATAVWAEVERRYVLLKRYHAERLNPTLLFDAQGRPSHFSVDTIDLTKIQPEYAN